MGGESALEKPQMLAKQETRTILGNGFFLPAFLLQRHDEDAWLKVKLLRIGS
jgi:hypothetical protein